MAQQPMTIDQMMQAYQQLTADFQAHRIDHATYTTGLTSLKAWDAEKRWWSCTPQGTFVWYDGSRWIPGRLPVGPAQPLLQAAPRLSGWRKLAATPILAILPGAVIGGIWFLYTLLRWILDEGVGVDILTPIILITLPLLLWLLRKPLDSLLRPLQKFQASFPFALRLGLALAVPMLTGCGCSLIATTGFSAVHFTALISTLFGYFLLHTPANKTFH